MSSTKRWAIGGALFGCVFPIVATALRTLQYGWEEAGALLLTDPLLWIICTAPFFLGLFAMFGGRQHDAVTDLANNLDRQVQERTAQLAGANVALAREAAGRAALLAGLSEGLLCFDREGRIRPERSAAMNRVLPGSDAEDRIDALLGRFAGTPPEVARDVLELLWDDGVFLSPFEETAAMLGTRCNLEVRGEPRHVDLEYRRLLDPDGRLDSVMMLARDVTVALQAREEQEAQQERVLRISIAANDLQAYRRFESEAKGLVNAISERIGGVERSVELKRDLHTLKGICRLFAFNAVAGRVNAIEDRIEQPDLSSDWEELVELWAQHGSDLRAVLGLEDRQQFVPVEEKKLDALSRVATELKEPRLERSVEDLYRHPAQHVFALHARMVDTIAKKLDRAATFEVAPSSCDVSQSELAEVECALAHVITNAVTHAAPELGAEAPLRVRLQSYRTTDGGLWIDVSDDGPGVDTSALVDKAIAQGLWTEASAREANAEARLELVFAEGLSSKLAAGAHAGRGVGLSAARASLRSVGGELQVASDPGHGSRFRIALPGREGLARLHATPARLDPATVDIVRSCETP